MQIPDRIGDYTLLGEIGRGGMGVVFRARDERTGQSVALKMLPPESLDKGDNALRFKREFRAIARVVHPNVIRVFEGGTYKNSPYFTMELVEGRDIRRWLDGDEPILKIGKGPPPVSTLSEEARARLNDPARVRRLAEAVVQVAFALGAIHAHRIVHRDLKPDNIMVTTAGVVKLMDFGIAKQINTGPSQDTSSGGMVVGTFKYLAPEQALGLEIDGRADLYCLGIILYELLAGRHPFFSETSVGYAYHHARTLPPPITRFNPEVNPGLRAIAERLLHKEPEKRYPTADDVITVLRDAVKGLDEHIESLRSTTGRLAPPPYHLSKDPLFRPVLVGRAQEIDSLTVAMQRTAAGEGQLVLVSGATGSGKSRLIKEAAAPIKETGLQLVWATAARTSGQPYGVFNEVMGELVRELQIRPVAEVEAMLGQDGPVLVRHLNALNKLPPAVRPRPVAPVGPDDEVVRLRAAVTDTLARAACSRPRMLVLDDLHQADEASLELLGHVARSLVVPADGAGVPLGVMVTVDPHLAEPESPCGRFITELAGLPRFKSITLKALSAGEAAQMMQAMVGGDEVATAVGHALIQDTGGIPFLVEARVRAWADSGDLVRTGRKWCLRPDKDSSFVDLQFATPSDMPTFRGKRSPHEAQLNSLSDAARDVAERASVLDGRLHGDVLLRVALRPEEAVLDAVDELLKRRVLTDSGDDEGYAFASEDVRTGIYQGLEPERRKRLHLLVAHALEDRGRRTGRGTEPEALARHYKLGGDPVRAFDYLAQSTRRALEVSATRAAVRYVAEAQQTADSLAATLSANDPDLLRRRAELLLVRLQTLSLLGNLKEMERIAQEGLPPLVGRVDPRLVAEAMFHEAFAKVYLGDTDKALSLITEVLQVTERGGAHPLRCRAKRLCGLIYERRGQPDRGLRYVMEALELARAIGDVPEEQAARMAIASRRLDTGNLDAAERDYALVLSEAQQRGERLRACACINVLGTIHHERANFTEAETNYRKARELALSVGHRRLLGQTTMNLGSSARDQGCPEDALRLYEEARRAFVATGAQDAQVDVDIATAHALLALDRNAEALEVARRACDTAEELMLALHEAEALLATGLASVRTGHADGMIELQTGLTRARAQESNRITLVGLWYSGLARMAVQDAQGAREVLEEGVARAERTGYRRYGAHLTQTLTLLDGSTA